MKKLMLTAALVMLATPALAKEYTVKEVSDPAGKRPYYFEPAELTIEPGDTVTFVNAQEDMHDVMFVSVPKGVGEMIMSPMHEKEGDAFSYTFTVPGTYQFHCHPHEQLGMKGTLIVGSPSKSGETIMMDHHKMTHESSEKKAATADSGLAQGTARVNAVNAAQHAINVTHDPIKALGWPKMKMEFSVDPSIDLSSIQAGDSVSFTLKPQGEGDYVIVTLSKNK